MYRLGVDIGGTFTDFALTGPALDGIDIHKQLTTPEDPSAAVLEGAALMLARHNIPLSEVAEIVHGTTLVTNAVIERRGARTGMLVTAGFADLLDIGLEQRYDLFDLRIRFAPPIIPRAQRREIAERIHYNGRVETALNQDNVRAQISDLIAAENIESLAVCFLHAYANPAHEDAVRRIAAADFPALYVSTSADVFPYMREFERWTTTTVNAYAQPRFDRYLQRLESGLAEGGFTGRLYLMSSSGGTVTPEAARRYPVRMLESGPAAGVLMSAEHGRRLGIHDVLAFDLGGTTAKGALIRQGKPLKSYAMEVARTYEHRRGSGLSLKLPVIDMTEIGAGGGSIAAVDERQLLRVGPRSAGAAPGPACYGRGGERPTLTDANLVLGYLDPAFFLGGRMHLDTNAAQAAIARDVADPLGIDGVRAAWGIHEVINEDIARAFRVHAVERGFDCRRTTLVAFGGGGPIHASGVARKLKATRVVYPLAAGVMSALGLLASPLAFEVARSYRIDLPQLDAANFARLIAELTTEASAVLTRAGVDKADIAIDARVDIRYRGQGHELEIPLSHSAPPDEELAALPQRFAERYRDIFKVTELDETLEAIAWKVEARAPVPTLPAASTTAVAEGSSLKGHRRAYLPESAAYADIPVYDRYRLRPGDSIDGPALIEEHESTCLLRAGDRATVDAQLNLVAEIAA